MTSGVIVAAGRGERFGGRVPKVFLSIKGRMILEFSMEAFQKVSAIDEIILVVPRGYLVSSFLGEWKRRFPKLSRVVCGAGHREESVHNGIRQCASESRYVLVHDAARPLVSSRLVERVLAATVKHGACIPVWPVFGSLKRVNGRFAQESGVTGHLFVAQTPQGCRKDVLLDVMQKQRKSLKDFSDEASLLVSAGIPVRAVKG